MQEIPRIRVLESSVVDRIAAGEVVERPAHLVKELVENSLDAGASEIHVEFSDGGREVTVADNGVGIHPDDLQKSLDRHATSKIAMSEDLWQLKTFGFRGEALASIAAVCKLSLSSRIAGKELGSKIESEFGKLSKTSGSGHAQGTRVQISELFANIPARLKFLKSASSEGTQIKTVIKALALAHPKVSFKITQESSLLAFYPAATDRRERAEAVLGVAPLFAGAAEREGVRAECVFADPHNVARTSKNIWLFAQDRWIQDRSLQAAVMEAYRNLLMHGEFPIAAVWVYSDPENIDVNIHPTKSQVKFIDPSLAFRAVQASLRDALEKAPWIQNQTGAAIHVRPAMTLQQMQVQPAQSMKFSAGELDRVQFQKKEIQWATATENASASAAASSTGYWSSLQVLGQAHLTYLICQSDDGIVLVDQHAAHERVMFEKLMSAWKGGAQDVQDFLFPLALDLAPEKAEALLSASPDFKKLGLELESLGPTTIGVKSAPLILKDVALTFALQMAADELHDQGGTGRFEKILGDICASLACHSAVRAGQAMSTEEMRSLLQKMDEFPLSSFCPHGRPVSVNYRLSELERDFGRLV